MTSLAVKQLHVFVALTIVASVGSAQTDPGPRKGPAAAGGNYPTLRVSEQAVFNQSADTFQEIDSVSGRIRGEDGKGLGPAFNGNSCAMCHAQPAVGGSSPGLRSPQKPVPNPQVALATLDGAHNAVPAFITVDGPVREARFVRDGSQSDGGVHALYTIAGRSDAAGCTLAQPDFASAIASRNVIFRIPTPVFGLGLVENTPDSVLQANLASGQAQKTALGISGRFNTSGNDGTLTRFGWKAQNKSLLVFAGEAYNVEQGVSNEIFPNERSAASGCVFNASPEDSSNLSATGTITAVSADVLSFALFMRLSAPPAAATATASERNGQVLFQTAGCAFCHSSSLTTGPSPYTGMSNVTYHPYSDFALHQMGSNLADGISQGAAAGNEFRTAPLWGVGQRLFFLHDGRSSDLLEAIQAHFSSGDNCSSGAGDLFTRISHAFGQNCGSEANLVIQRFNAFSSTQQQDLLNVLRSL